MEKYSNKRWLRIRIFLISIFLIGINILTSQVSFDKQESLKEALEGKFYIGTALNAWQIRDQKAEELEVVKNNFNSIVAENIMKSGRIQPEQGKFEFDLADQFVEFGEDNNMHIHGHTLIWHSQAPRWFFTDKEGNEVTKKELTQRMKNHIQAVVGRYKGRIDSWDVVNEAIEDDGSYRESKFYKILGKDFIKLAFKFAHEADPKAKLYYNDYSMYRPGKREGVVRMVKELKEDGIHIDGIGMQGHVGMTKPELLEMDKSIAAFGAMGTVSISELDLSVLPSPWGDTGAEISKNFEYEDKMNPFPEGLPEEVSTQFTKRYLEFFKLFLKYQDKIERVTLWGVNDGNSWKNKFPVRGRTDYPLLFDRENQPKAIVYSIIRIANKI